MIFIAIHIYQKYRFTSNYILLKSWYCTCFHGKKIACFPNWNVKTISNYYGKAHYIHQNEKCEVCHMILLPGFHVLDIENAFRVIIWSTIIFTFDNISFSQSFCSRSVDIQFINCIYIFIFVGVSLFVGGNKINFPYQRFLIR